MNRNHLKVLVLAGGPDRERDISLISGATITAAVSQAGHEVWQRDITPDNLSALDEFVANKGDVIFPILHGAWGEGGQLQAILDQRNLPYVGCRAPSSKLCMDKDAAKQALLAAGLPTPPSQLLTPGIKRTLDTPLVLKPPLEGSSIDIEICQNPEQVRRARTRLQRRHQTLLAERYIVGKELTVGIIAGPDGKLRALPPIHIVPATAFYDYSAKYDRDDTQYLFKIALPAPVLADIADISVKAAVALGCRHLCRVDLIVDHDNQPWILEINTLPGFTSHSLLPKAAAHSGIPVPKLVESLLRHALADAVAPVRSI
jgi:D-alanine-D-alanine ligase